MVIRRLAKASDCSTVHSIYMEPSVVPFLGYDPMPLDEFRPIYDDLVASKCFFVYEVNGQIAGFYKASRYQGRAMHVAYVGSLAIAPKFQSQGIAMDMMTEALDELVKDGVKRVELIVECDNPRAVAFYKRLGFQIEGTLRHFYKRASDANYVDDYMMSKIFE